MKFFGLELKFNGFDIWHKGNFTPSKVATSNNYNDLDNKPSTLPANGGNADTVDGKHASDFYQDGSVIMNTNPFGGKRLFINNINNAIFNAHKRWQVTGNIYNSDDTIYSTISDFSLLFNGDYESSLSIPAGKYAKINITFNGGNFPGYPYGYLYLSHYYTNWSQSAKLRVYCNYEPHGLGWHEYDFSDFVRNGSNLILVVREPVYGISQMEFIIYAPTDKNTLISQIDYQLDRPGQIEMPLLDKYKQNKLYYPLDMNSNKLLNLAIPTNANDAANKTYVDGEVAKKADSSHTHTKSQVTDMPTKLSQFTNDIGAGGGVKITTAATAPTSPNPGDFWYKEI